MRMTGRTGRLVAAGVPVLAGLVLAGGAAGASASAHTRPASAANSAPTVWVVLGNGDTWGAVRPVSTATSKPKPRVKTPEDSTLAASTPDGKTAYVIGLLPKGVNGNKSVLSPISTATNKAGTPIVVGQGEFDLTIAP